MLQARLAVLAATGLAEAGTGIPVLDRLAGVVTRLLEAPVALVTVLDGERQLVCGSAGIPGVIAATPTPLGGSLCTVVVGEGAGVVLNDLRCDSRTAANGAVTTQGIVAYAGAPLTLDGHVLGSVCALDYRPREWTASDREGLEDLAAAASDIVLAQLRFPPAAP